LAAKNITDFNVIVTKFLDCLLDREHTINTLKPIFIQAATVLDNRMLASTITTKYTDNTLYIHQTFHPNGIKPFEIRQLCEKILRPSLTYNRMIITAKKPKGCSHPNGLSLPSGSRCPRHGRETQSKLRYYINLKGILQSHLVSPTKVYYSQRKKGHPSQEKRRSLQLTPLTKVYYLQSKCKSTLYNRAQGSFSNGPTLPS
jgi:hypothetical protein